MAVNVESLTTQPATAESTPPYRDASRPAEQRVADLLGRMTLEEKAAQMMCVWQQKG